MDGLVESGSGGNSVKYGIIAALIGGGVAWAAGWLLIVGFGLLAFAQSWATFVTIAGLSIVTLQAYSFLPLAIVFSAAAGAWLTRRRFGRLAGRPYWATILVAVLLLTLLSVPVTIMLLSRGGRLLQEADRVQQVRDVTVADVVRVTDVSVAATGESIVIRPRVVGILPGQYQVQMTISDRSSLVTRAITVRLPDGSAALQWAVPLAELRQAYRQKLLTGTQPALVESTFSIRVEMKLVTSDDASLNTVLPPQAPERSSAADGTIKLDLGAV